MATVITNMLDPARMESFATSALTTFDDISAFVEADLQALFDEMDTDDEPIETVTDTQITLVFQYGSILVIEGFNLENLANGTLNPYTITRINLTSFNGIILDITGALTIDPGTETISGSLNSLDIVTSWFTASIDISASSLDEFSNSLTFSNIDITVPDILGGDTEFHLSVSGAMTVDDQGLSGTVSGLTLISGSDSFVATNLNGNVADLINATSADQFFSMLLSGSDYISGTGGNDYLRGYDGNDILFGGAGIDNLDGGTALDTAIFTGIRSNYGIVNSDSSFTITDTLGTDGIDTLSNIERLQFTDKKFALDLAPTENAGQALLFIGVLAPDLIESPEVVGLILNFVDGGVNMLQLTQLAVDIGLVYNLAGGSSDADVARLAFENVVGAPATPDMIDFLVSFMDGRSEDFTQSEFLAVVANLAVNQLNVDLVGLAQTGIEYAVG